MPASVRFALAAVSVCLLAAAEIAPTMAQYQGPRGHYTSVSSYVRDVEGTPCGMNCTRAAQKRWSRNYGNTRSYSAK
jgi:hypothetical protein